MMRPFALFLLAAGLAASAAAAPLRLDLGDGLEFVRIHELPADLPPAGALGAHPVVLDLRYVHAGAAGASSLLAWLKAQADVRHPVIVLVNSRTSAGLLSPLSSADAVPGVVIIGPDAPNIAVDIAVDSPPGEERRAYEALEHGTPARTLIDDNPPKVRDDEARLEREHLPDSDDEPPEQDEAAMNWTPPLTDFALQRAVQLDRALIALHRI